MKFLKILLYILLGLAVIVVILMFIAPTNIKVERSVMIKSSSKNLYSLASSFENGRKWSPWEELDPNMTKKIEGNDGTVGAKYSWSGNEKVGEGNQIITKLEEGKSIESHITFLKPFKSEADIVYSIAENGDSTKVTWAFSTTMSRPFNIMCLFMDMDKMLGKDFEHGLDKLKKLAESSAMESDKKFEITETEGTAKTYVGVKETIGIKEENFMNFFAKHYPEIGKKLGREISGPSAALYFSWDDKKEMKTELAAVFPVKNAKVAVPKGCEKWEIAASKCLVIDYWGNYDKMADAHNALQNYIDEKKLTKVAPVIEEYIAGPGQEKDTAKWETKIIYMVK